MFEVAEIGRSVSKERVRLGGGFRWEPPDAQRRLDGAAVPVIVLFGAVDGAGKSETCTC